MRGMTGMRENANIYINSDDSKSMTLRKLVQRITCGAAIPLMQTVFRTFPYYSSLEMFLDLVFERYPFVSDERRDQRGKNNQ